MKNLFLTSTVFLIVSCGGESSTDQCTELSQNTCIPENQVLQFEGSHHHGYDHLTMPEIILKNGDYVAYWEFENGTFSDDGNLQFWTTGDPGKLSLKVYDNYEYTEECKIRALLQNGEYTPFQTVLINAGRLQ
jgi:hypothetical protein